MNIAILLYERFTALDAIGPYEVLSRLPGASVTFVAAEPGPVRTDNGMLTILAEHSLEELPAPEIVLVPGGPGEVAARAGGPVLEWLRAVHDEHLDHLGVHRLADPRGRRSARRPASDRPLARHGEAPRAGRRGRLRARRVRRQDRDRGGRVGRDRHGARARREDRGRAGRAGDSAGHRVRPAAAVRRQGLRLQRLPSGGSSSGCARRSRFVAGDAVDEWETAEGFQQFFAEDMA